MPAVTLKVSVFEASGPDHDERTSAPEVAWKLRALSGRLSGNDGS